MKICTVAKLTGVNPVTLRAWERRYGLLQPKRTAKGHRLYTEQQIQQVKLILQWIEKGVPVSQVKSLLEKSTITVTPLSSPAPNNYWQKCYERMQLAIQHFDLLLLEDIYNEALSIYPIELVTQQLLLPLLQQFDRYSRMQDKAPPGKIAEKHFFTHYIRNKLGARFHHTNIKSNGPVLLFACLPEEYYDLELLILSLYLMSYNYRGILLGANTPLSEISYVVDKAKCQAIVLVGQVSSQLQPNFLEFAAQTPVPVLLGSQQDGQMEPVLQNHNVILLANDSRITLRQVKTAIQRNQNKVKVS